MASTTVAHDAYFIELREPLEEGSIILLPCPLALLLSLLRRLGYVLPNTMSERTKVSQDHVGFPLYAGSSPCNIPGRCVNEQALYKGIVFKIWIALEHLATMSGIENTPPDQLYLISGFNILVFGYYKPRTVLESSAVSLLEVLLHGLVVHKLTPHQLRYHRTVLTTVSQKSGMAARRSPLFSYSGRLCAT